MNCAAYGSGAPTAFGFSRTRSVPSPLSDRRIITISVRPELVEGPDALRGEVGLHATSALRGRAGPVTFLLRQRKEPKKGDPDIRPDPGLAVETSRGPKLDRGTLNKSWRCSAPRFGMQCEEKSAAIAQAMASIFDEAMRPKRGCDARRGLVQRFPRLKQRAASSTFLLSIPGSHARGPGRTDD